MGDILQTSDDVTVTDVSLDAASGIELLDVRYQNTESSVLYSSLDPEQSESSWDAMEPLIGVTLAAGDEINLLAMLEHKSGEEGHAASMVITYETEDGSTHSAQTSTEVVMRESCS